jgi:hypothetical protein
MFKRTYPKPEPIPEDFPRRFQSFLQRKYPTEASVLQDMIQHPAPGFNNVSKKKQREYAHGFYERYVLGKEQE